MYPMLSSVDSRTLVVLFGRTSFRLISERLLRGPESFSSSRIARARRTEFDCDPTLSQDLPLTTGGKARCTCSNDIGNLHPNAGMVSQTREWVYALPSSGQSRRTIFRSEDECGCGNQQRALAPLLPPTPMVAIQAVGANLKLEPEHDLSVPRRPRVQRIDIPEPAREIARRIPGGGGER